ncbi:MAG TPA: ribose 5-phosphate isomerase A [Deltaproteobacteria bacterium]|mgnify:CR=1 FL=1|nr:ribose 5-phosphate isomerase A [Deltaproteobacteria bacterium]
MTADSKTMDFKKAAALKAVSLLRSGMVIGLGHGSTAIFAVREIAELIREGVLKDILGIPCSFQVEQEARGLGIPLTTLDEHPAIDITIDGADEVDEDLNLIKGGGGALLREKIVAQASRREIIIVDESKLSPVLGTRQPVPVEVVPFGLKGHTAYMESLGARVRIRRDSDGEFFMTDHGNVILDCDFGPIREPVKLAEALKSKAGIVEHGLFLGIADDVFVSGALGNRHMVRGKGS